MNNKIRVLLVDDVRFVRDRLAELLVETAGVEIVGQADDVDAGIHLVEELKPDVVVLDIDFPGRSGTELLETVRKRSSNPVIVVLSNYVFPALRQHCADLGANFIFCKATEPEKVVQVCQDLLDARRQNEAGGRSQEPGSKLDPQA